MENTMQVSEEVIFTIIASAGEANGLLQKAFLSSQEGKYDEVDELLIKANEALNEAHKIQTSLINNEVQGNKVEMGVLMVHAQDHLMNVILTKQMITNMILLQKEINEIKIRGEKQ